MKNDLYPKLVPPSENINDSENTTMPLFTEETFNLDKGNEIELLDVVPPEINTQVNKNSKKVKKKQSKEQKMIITLISILAFLVVIVFLCFFVLF